MSKKSDAVKRWRKNTKERMVNSFGGKCGICGYDKCFEALEFHHLDPSKKDFGFGSSRANICSWEKVVEELRKCICLCSNCHKEVHYGITPVPKDPIMFDEKYNKYKEMNELDKCPVCGKDKKKSNKYCSLRCAGISHYRIRWDEINLEEEIKSGKSYIEIAEKLGISSAAVIKRARKINII